MVNIDKKELFKIEGGVNLSGTLINSFATIIKALLEVGRNLGSAIRRISGDDMCPIK